MDAFTIGLWSGSLLLMAAAFIKSRPKTFAAMKKSKKIMGNMLGDFIAIIFMIGLILTRVPPEAIRTFLGSSNTEIATVAAALAGSVTLIPGFLAFPLVGSLVNAGASIVPAVAFLTTLTMVGIITYPLESSEFGARFAILRNALGFVFAIAIALAMGVIL
ncbi:MAG TPA: permease [Clostridiales bacterium]|jgi:uncharacterized membrane protein YraQ (UPF0718 family)|nr:permease [Clostridiales bacterium]